MREQPESGPAPSDHLARSMLVVGVTVLVLVFLVALVVAFRSGDVLPNDDQALIELRVLDVGSHTPLVGSYERFGGNQPGPLHFYVLAAPYRLLGSDASALAVGAVLVTFAAVAGCVVVAARRGGPLGALWAIGLLLVLLLARGTAVLTSVWEPQTLLVALALLVLLLWETATESVWALPVAAAVGSLLAQSWVGYGIFVAVLGLAGAALGVGNVVRERRSPGARPHAVAALVATFVVLGVLWLPPIVEQLVRDPGNVTELASIDRTGPHAGIVDGYRAVAGEFGLDAPWLRGAIPTAPLSITVDFEAGDGFPLALVVFVVATVVAAWRRATAALWLDALVAATLVAAVVTIAMIFGGVFVWIVEPDRVVGLLLWFAAGVSVVASLGPVARHRVTTVLAPVLALGIAALAVAFVVAVVQPPDTAHRQARAVGRLADAVLADRSDLPGPVLVRSTARASSFGGDVCCGPMLASVLARSGVDVVVPRDQGDRYGTHRARPRSARSELLLTTDSSRTAPAGPGWSLVATADPLDPHQRAERRTLDRELRRFLGPDPDLVEVATAQQRHPEVRELLRARDALPDLAPFALYERRLTPVPPA